MIFVIDKHDVGTEHLEKLEVDPCRLIHEDLHVRKHSRYPIAEFAIFG